MWTPHKGQVPVAKALLRNWKRYVFLQCGRKFGKALDLHTPILTPDGFKPIGEIEEGDTVYNEKGEKIKVLVAHDIIQNPKSYRVHFCNGTYIDACKDHRWSTYTKLDRKSMSRGNPREMKVRTTQEIFETQMHGKEYNHSIPYTKAIGFKEVDLPIDPYILGAWVGDGNTYRAGFSTIDEEILEQFTSKGYGVSHYSGCDYGITGGLITQLKELGVIRNKHIPKKYLMASKEQRLSLLQGLMDTDGWIKENGAAAEFYSTLPQVAESVRFLVASLGMKPLCSVKKTIHKDCHVVRFKPLIEVFRLTRKKNRIKADSFKTLHHTIVKVEEIDSKPMRCLTVSGESSLFLAGKDLIPTHNTDFAIYCMYMFAILFPNSQIYYIADTMKHAGELVWHNQRLQKFFTTTKRLKGESDDQFAERRKLGQALQDKYIDKANNSEMRLHFKNGSFIKVDGAENYANADGIEPDFLVYDEFKSHDPRFNEAMEPNLRVKKAPLLIVGTPPEEMGTYYEKIANSFKRLSYGEHFQRPSYLNSHIYPNGEKDIEFVEECEKYLSRGDEDVMKRELYAEIVVSGKKALFPMLELPSYDYETNKYVGSSRHVRPHTELMKLIQRAPKDYEFFDTYDPGSAVCFAGLFGVLNKYTKDVYILDCIYAKDTRDTSVGVIYPEAQQIMNGIYPVEDYWWGTYDHAATWFRNEVQDRYGRALNPCEKDLKNKENKLSMIKDMLNERKLIFSDNCMKGIQEDSGILWEMMNYRKDQNGKIPKENDHAIDALRYKLNAMGYNPTWLEKPKTGVLDYRGMSLTYTGDGLDYYNNKDEKRYLEIMPREEYE